MLKVLTCNIRCCIANDGDNNWKYRRGLCADVIRRQDADIIGFQEMHWPQYEDLREALPGYDHKLMSESMTAKNSLNTIFYRRDRLELISCGGFWLSLTPHVPESRSWDSAHIRFANWIRVEDRQTGLHFRLINTHLDNLSQAAREGQARTLCEEASFYPDDFPQILTGDFNCDASNPAIAIIGSEGWKDSYEAIHGVREPGFTYHGFQGVNFVPTPRSDHGKGVGRIDWIFYRGALKPTAAEVIRDCDGNRWPSDHFFISATFNPA